MKRKALLATTSTLITSITEPYTIPVAGRTGTLYTLTALAVSRAVGSWYTAYRLLDLVSRPETLHIIPYTVSRIRVFE